MYLRSGVDLVSLQRFEEALQRRGQRLLERIFTKTEIEQSDGRVQSLAARFAVKEAVSKAIGCGIGEIGWREIEVRVDEKGAPHLYFYGSAAQKVAQQQWRHWSVSLSHTAEVALAMVVALCEATSEQD